MTAERKKPGRPKKSRKDPVAPSIDNGGRDQNGSFLPGNQLWKLAKNPGRPLKFKTPEELLEKCLKFFAWASANPLVEERVFHHQGEITRTYITKMRALTQEGLYVFIGANPQMWSEYRQRPEFGDVIAYVERIMHEQKFTGAAADLLNANIISRHLGLVDKRESNDSVTLVIAKDDAECL